MDGDDGDGPATDGVSRNVAGKRRKKTASATPRDSAQRRSLVDELNDPTASRAGWRRSGGACPD